MVSKNYSKYSARREPDILTKLNYGKSLPHYPPIRQITDKKVLRALIGELEISGEDYVIMSWVSPADNRVIGYGLYTKEEADSITRESDIENWGFPQVGRQYSKSALEEKLKKK